MIDLILSIIDYYSNHFSEILTTYADYSVFYGWLAGASALVALITIIAAIFRREAGGGAAAAVGQHVLVWGLPFLIQAGIGLWGTA